jgi:hypothetical protein
MKSVLIILSFLFSSVSFAAVSPENLTYHRISNCTYWTFLTGVSPSGYLCASYPWDVNVADAQSTADNLNALSERIKQLEARIQQLETQLQ